MFDCISLVYAWFVPRVSHFRRVFHSSARPVCESAYWFAVSRRYARLAELLFVASVAVALMLMGGVVMVPASWLLALLLSPVPFGLLRIVPALCRQWFPVIVEHPVRSVVVVLCWRLLAAR